MQITKEEIKNTTLKEIQQPTLPYLRNLRPYDPFPSCTAVIFGGGICPGPGPDPPGSLPEEEEAEGIESG